MADTNGNGNGNGTATVRRYDVLSFRLVIALAGGCALVCCVGFILLALNHCEIPPALQTLGATAVGGLVGLLAATPRAG